MALMVLCCAGPTLVAAGVLGSVGAFLGNPVVIAAGVLLAVAAVVIVVRRRPRVQPPGSGVIDEPPRARPVTEPP